LKSQHLYITAYYLKYSDVTSEEETKMNKKQIPKGTVLVKWQDAEARIFEDLFFAGTQDKFKDTLYEAGGMILSITKAEEDN